jgi:FMN reductase (NADPH)/FMN reductase [NAD(P)H]
MNDIIEVLHKRKSVRAYTDQPIPAEVKAQVLQVTLRAPTAGNMMLYSIIDVTDQRIKDRLAVTCDDQPFIAKAPMVWLFLADYQRWMDYFLHSGVEAACAERGVPFRKPEEGDLFLACCDALIAAQNAVIAAESLGLGSCYIGDILEQYEAHRELFALPRYAFPICLLCFGYPTQGQIDRPQTSRFDEKYIVFEDRYRSLAGEEFDKMFREREALRAKNAGPDTPPNVGQASYFRKFSADFSIEMNRSVRAMLKAWTEG